MKPGKHTARIRAHRSNQAARQEKEHRRIVRRLWLDKHPDYMRDYGKKWRAMMASKQQEIFEHDEKA